MSGSEFTNDEIRRIDTSRHPQLFGELVDFASEVLLGRPLEITPFSPSESIEAKIVAQLGTRGISMALDMIDNPITMDFYESSFRETDLKDDTIIRIDSSLRTGSERLSDPVNFEIIDIAKQFGKELLKDAYLALGPGVEKQLHRMRHAKNVEQQIAVINWLESRFDAIKALDVENKDEDKPNENGAYSFNPLRLSRRFTGDYPNIHTKPTCLGISIIAASFFEHAGMTHLHAGVLHDITNTGVGFLSDTMRIGLENLTAIHPYKLNLPVALAVVSKVIEFETNMAQDAGYHAANYLKMIDGSWYQFDPNFKATLPINTSPTSSRLDVAYEEISSLQDIAPGIERTIASLILTIPNQLYEWQDAIEWSYLPEDKIREIMMNDESILDNLTSLACQHIIEHYAAFYPEIARNNIDLLLERNILSEAARTTIHKYVLWESKDLAQFSQRCMDDPQFLSRRLEDMQLAQHFIIPAAILDSLHNISPKEAGAPHSAFELGDPATRIGFSVLGDFATFFDSRLPANFWTSHWPSKIPITETLSLEEEELSDEERAFQLDSLRHLITLPYALRYLKSNVIISKSLSPITHLKGGEQDAKES